MVRVIMIVDETGSMSSNKEVTISAYNEFLDSQRLSASEDETAEDITSFSLVKFNVNSRTQEVPNIKDSVPLTSDTYKPSNCTALYDAIGDALEMYKEELDNICVIITDGQENASRRFNQKQVFDKIKIFTDDKGWIFQYLGANQDAFAVGGSMNIAQNQTFSADTAGFKNVYNNMESEVQVQRGYQNYKKKARDVRSKDLSAPPPEFQSFESYKQSKSTTIQKVIESRKGSKK